MNIGITGPIGCVIPDTTTIKFRNICFKETIRDSCLTSILNSGPKPRKVARKCTMLHVNLRIYVAVTEIHDSSTNPIIPKTSMVIMKKCLSNNRLADFCGRVVGSIKSTTLKCGILGKNCVIYFKRVDIVDTATSLLESFYLARHITRNCAALYRSRPGIVNTATMQRQLFPVRPNQLPFPSN